jgi:hypothetical protein
VRCRGEERYSRIRSPHVEQNIAFTCSSLPHARQWLETTGLGACPVMPMPPTTGFAVRLFTIVEPIFAINEAGVVPRSIPTITRPTSCLISVRSPSISFFVASSITCGHRIFVVSSRCPFQSPFHAGFSSLIERSRMLAARSRFMLISSQLVHVQDDPVGESRKIGFPTASSERAVSKTLAVPADRQSIAEHRLSNYRNPFEERLFQEVRGCARGGRVIVPCQALGRAMWTAARCTTASA